MLHSDYKSERASRGVGTSVIGVRASNGGNRCELVKVVREDKTRPSKVCPQGQHNEIIARR